MAEDKKLELLKLSWRKGGDFPTATELNKLVAKVNEVVGVANNGFSSNTSGGEGAPSSFDWTTIPSASVYSRGLMTAEMAEKLASLTNITILTDVDYSTSNDAVSAFYVDKHFVNKTTYNNFTKSLDEWKKTVPTLGGNNTFTGNNYFNGETHIKDLHIGDNKIDLIYVSSDEPTNSDTALVTSGHVSNFYLRKDEGDWTAEGNYTFSGELIIGDIFRTELWEDNDFVGFGVGIYQVGGKGYIKTDNLVVRETAWFRSVTIEETKHIGGETVLSCAYCIISLVRPFTYNGKSYFACFFDKEKNGKKASQMWEVGDQARLQQTSATKTSLDARFYWRVVVKCGDGANIGNDYPELTDIFSSWCDDYYYIVLSNNDFEYLGEGYVNAEGFTGSAIPEVNDEVVLLGNRNLSQSKNYRRAAQVYSTADTISSPLRRYYTGIGTVQGEDDYGEMRYLPFSLEGCEIETMEYNQRENGTKWRVGHGDNFLQYTDKEGIEARLSKLNIVTNGKDTDVADALADNFKFINSSDEAPREEGKIAEWIPASEIDPSNSWGEEECQEHVGDYMITTDGFAYEFVFDEEYGWQISSDQHLIHAQETADAAVKNLADMANDNIITIQEKKDIVSIVEQMENERSAIAEEVLSFLTDEDVQEAYAAYEDAYKALKAFLDYFLLSRDNDTELVVGDTILSAIKRRIIGGEGYSISYQKGMGMSYESARYNYYLALPVLRKTITEATKQYVVRVEEGSIDEEIKKDVESLRKELADVEDGVITNFDGDRGTIVTKKGTEISGFLTKSNYASIFASGIGQEGKDLQAAITAYVDDWYSGVSITADKISLSATNSLKIESGQMEIHTKNFDLDEDGFVTLRGLQRKGHLDIDEYTYGHYFKKNEDYPDHTLNLIDTQAGGYNYIHILRANEGDIIVLPSFNTQDSLTQKELDNIRDYIGQEVVIYNNSKTKLKVQGIFFEGTDFNSSGQMIPAKRKTEYELPDNFMLCARGHATRPPTSVMLDVDNGEIVWWDVTLNFIHAPK